MIGYQTVGTNDFDKAVAFYEALFEDLGATRIFENPGRFVAWGTGPGKAGFSVCTPHDGQPATVGNGCMTAFACKSTELVDKLYNKGIALGGTDEGAPGPRGDGSFYGGYLRDLDGNKMVFFNMKKG